MNLKIEIRPCAGGQEAELLCEEMLNVYIKYCKKKNIIYEINQSGKTTLLFVSGTSKILSTFFNESGIHKFQRVSKTERNGRMHTSTVSITVLEDNKNTESELYNLKDIRIDYFHCGGKGGQNVNKVQTGVRIVHYPSGIVIESTNERSQKQNKTNAFNLLYQKLKEQNANASAALENSNRYAQVQNGERSESKRIYNEKRNEIFDQTTQKTCSYKEFFKGNIELLN
jgi:peptide chain release factor 1